MSRPRAFLAVLLAAAWCSAAWHVNLEALGLLFEHEHHAHDHHHAHTSGSHSHAGHEPTGSLEDHHEPVLSRDTTKDGQFRIGFAAALLSVAMLAALGLCAAAFPRVQLSTTAWLRRRREGALIESWKFVQRCVSESGAPPALG